MIKLGRYPFLPSFKNILLKRIHPNDCLTQYDPNFDQILLLRIEGSARLIHKGHFLRDKK